MHFRVPIEHVEGLIVRSQPGVAEEAHAALLVLVCDEFDIRAQISPSHNFHHFVANMIPKEQEKSAQPNPLVRSTQHTEEGRSLTCLPSAT